MATLTAEQREAIRADVMRRFSSTREPVPGLRADMLTLVGYIDDALEAAEGNVINRIPGNHPGRQWLIDNQHLGRQLMLWIEQVRKDVF